MTSPGIEITFDKKKLGKHTEPINDNIIFFPHLNRLISCSDDYSVIIWDYETDDELYKYSTLRKCVNGCIKFDEENALTVDSGGELVMFNIRTASLVKTIIKRENELIQVLKLAEDIVLLTHWGTNELVVVRVSTGEITATLEEQTLYFGNRADLSKSMPNTFFLYQSGRDESGLEQIDFVKNESVKRFSRTSDCHVFCSYLNFKGEETLVSLSIDYISLFKVAGMEKLVSPFGICDSVGAENHLGSCILFPTIANDAYSSNLSNIPSFPQYLCVDAGRDIVSIREVDDNFKEVARLKIPNSMLITSFGLKQTKNEMKIFVAFECMGDGNIEYVIHTLTVKNIKLPSEIGDLERKDLEERIEYLMKEFVDLNKEENEKMFFWMIGSFGEMNMFRTLLV